MKAHITLIVSIFADSLTAAPTAMRWQSPDKFYSIVVPADWKQTEYKGESGSSFGFISPDQQAEIRISATYHLNLPEVLPVDVLEIAFPNERRLTGIERIRGDGWDGLRREYTNTSATRRWSAVAARKESTIVLLTMTAPATAFAQFELTFKGVSKSLKLGK